MCYIYIYIYNIYIYTYTLHIYTYIYTLHIYIYIFNIYIHIYIYTYIHIYIHPLRGWSSLTMALTGKFVYMAHHFIMLRLNPFGLRVDRERCWFEHSMS